MTATTILPEAESELWNAVAYYDRQFPGLGMDFLAAIQTSVEAISEAPGRWPLRGDGTRRILTHRFPYVVVYVLVPDQVWIIAFAHCKRNPKYWAKRMRVA